VNRRFDDLNAVWEFDALDNLDQLVFALQAPPCFAAAETSLNTMNLGAVLKNRLSTDAIGGEAPRRSVCIAHRDVGDSHASRRHLEPATPLSHPGVLDGRRREPETARGSSSRHSRSCSAKLKRKRISRDSVYLLRHLLAFIRYSIE
jgi:hypothetical protein